VQNVHGGEQHVELTCLIGLPLLVGLQLPGASLDQILHFASCVVRVAWRSMVTALRITPQIGNVRRS
jgi:hypothetical protein